MVTIRINGQDVCSSLSESNCGCCGEISGTIVDCRVFEYNGEKFEVPPKEMLADAILKAVYGEEKNVFLMGRKNKMVYSSDMGGKHVLY